MPIEPRRDSIRWGYDLIDVMESNGVGGACWWCKTTWAQWAHDSLHRDGSAFKAHLAKDKAALELFLKRRADLITKRKRKASQQEKRPGGVKRVSVRTKQFSKRYLEKPPHELLVFSAGIAAGTTLPSRKENQSLGHKKFAFEGHVGVLVPGDDGAGPWKVRTEEGREIAKAESEDVGSSGGEDDVAEAKFDALKKADDDNYAAVAQGAMSDILQGFVLGEDDRKEEEKRIARRLAIRKKGRRLQQMQRLRATKK